MLTGRFVTIIGAGVAGLSAASALAMHGADVRVFERAPSLEDVGAGLQISPNGSAVLNAIGIDPLQFGIRSNAVELKNHATSRSVLRLTLLPERWSHPFVMLHRATLIATLADRARTLGVKIELSSNIQMSDSDADLVVGADGVKSETRTSLNGTNAPHFTKQVAWRAIINDSALPEAHVYMGPGRHLVTYPVGDGLRNIVAVEERQGWEEEGWSHSDDPENLRNSFSGFAPEVRNWLGQVEEVGLWGLFWHPMAERWHDGRVAILGDAAHPTLPFLAQGANLALEDAWVLAKMLDRFPQAKALSRYESARKPRVARAIAAANANARNYHLRNPIVRFAAHSILRIGAAVAPDKALNRFDWLYGHDVTATYE